jgi:hypothetical protein
MFQNKNFYKVVSLCFLCLAVLRFLTVRGY